MSGLSHACVHTCVPLRFIYSVFWDANNMSHVAGYILAEACLVVDFVPEDLRECLFVALRRW